MSDLLIERSSEILTLTLNRPEKMNALSASLVEALLAAIEAAKHEDTCLLVLRGNGKNFSAGFDFSGYEEQSDGDLLLRFIRIEQLLQAVHHAPFDTLALSHGKNFGAGVDLIGTCATRVATADASFRMPGLRFGLLLGTRRFASQVGADRARAILQETKVLGSEEALSLGFLHRTAELPQWPDVVAQAKDISRMLSKKTSSRLFRALRQDTRDEDLADLVRSAAEPNLKARIAAYLGSR